MWLQLSIFSGSLHHRLINIRLSLSRKSSATSSLTCDCPFSRPSPHRLINMLWSILSWSPGPRLINIRYMCTSIVISHVLYTAWELAIFHWCWKPEFSTDPSPPAQLSYCSYPESPDVDCHKHCLLLPFARPWPHLLIALLHAHLAVRPQCQMFTCAHIKYN